MRTHFCCFHADVIFHETSPWDNAEETALGADMSDNSDCNQQRIGGYRVLLQELLCFAHSLHPNPNLIQANVFMFESPVRLELSIRIAQ
jgi:hypothetical protein